MPPPLVLLEKVSFYYPTATRPALFDLDLAITEGEIVGILGATGSGKTTLCLALNGVVPQFFGGRFFGAVTVAGLDTLSHPIHRLAACISLVLQDPETQLIAATVESEIAFALENLSIPRDEILHRVDEALVAVELNDVRAKHPHQLSGGQQQRLALAAALAVRPRVVVLDEPTSQLDPRSAAEVFTLVRELNQRLGTTFLITGHASEEMAETIHRAVVLSHGRIVADGTPEQIYRDLPLLRRERVRPPDVTSAFALLAQRGLVDGPAPIRLEHGLAKIPRLPPTALFVAPDQLPLDSGLPILALKDISYTYPDGSPALHEVTLAIQRRDYVVILGQNGAGKSTLIRHFLQLLKPSSGEVQIDGVPLTTYSVTELARRIGYVPQNPDRQLFNATVEAEVGFSLRTLTLTAAEKAARVTEVLAALKLEEVRHAHPFSLSKGDRARVVIAAVLVLQPEVLIFDEPTTGQDDAGARAILGLTRTLHASGRTIIVITHHLHLMPGYANRAVVMGRGRVLFDSTLRAVYHAFEVLGSTHLRPTQTVMLARHSHPLNRAITPAELASCFPDSPSQTTIEQ